MSNSPYNQDDNNLDDTTPDSDKDSDFPTHPDQPDIPESRKYQGIPLDKAEKSAEELTEMLGWGLWEVGVFSGDGGLSFHVYLRPQSADIQAIFIPPYTEDE